MKQFTIITLFPNLFTEFVSSSILGKAIKSGKIKINVVDLRQYSDLKYHQVDEYQIGGGQGMVLMAPIVVKAIEDVRTINSYVILLSPQGIKFDNTVAHQLAAPDYEHLILVCGHYEGFDERILKYVDCEMSIGDYVITGGEIASMVIVDAVARLSSDVIRGASHENDSFNNNLLDYPVYTKPLEFRGDEVPAVLLSGHHKNINEWRAYHALKNTYLKRPDLIKEPELTQEQRKNLEKIKQELSERKE